MVRPPLLLCLLALALPAAAQDNVFATLTTDKEAYGYGETVELTYTITNAGEETFTVWGSTTCVVGFVWGSLVHPGGGACTLDDRPYHVPAGGSMSWLWRLDPAGHAVPEVDGEQTILAGAGIMFDSTSVEGARLLASVTLAAPRYLQGAVTVWLAEGVTLDDVADVMEALNATVLESSGQIHYWEIDGTSAADAIAAYEDDERFDRMWIQRQPTYYADEWTSASESTAPIVAALSAAHPNPFTTAATLTLSPPHPGPARVEAFDVLGRRVAVLYDGPLPAGAAHPFTLDAGGLPAGVYVVRATGAGYAFSRRVTLAR